MKVKCALSGVSNPFGVHKFCDECGIERKRSAVAG